MMDKSKSYYVYILFDWLGIPRYVGKGRRQRWFVHERITDPNNRDKNEFIERTWIMLGEIPKIKIAENLSNDDANTIEIAFIAAIGRADERKGPLTNLTLGGDGAIGYHVSQHQRKRASDFQKWLWTQRTPQQRIDYINRLKEGQARQEPLDPVKLEELKNIRREYMKEHWATLTPAERSIRTRNGGLALMNLLTVEERQERARKAATLGASKGGKASAAKLTPEQRSERSRRANLAIPLEQRQARGRKGGLNQSIETRHRKAERIRERNLNMPEEERERINQILRDIVTNRPLEIRREISRKGNEAKRIKRLTGQLDFFKILEEEQFEET